MIKLISFFTTTLIVSFAICASTDSVDIKQTMESNGVVPDVIDVAPEKVVKVR